MRRILWLRRDLRLKDNPLFSLGGEVLPIFIFDTHILASLAKDDRRITFIFHHLLSLKSELKELGLDLKVFYGNPTDVFDYLLKESFDEVVATGDYDSYAKQRDLEVSLKLHFRYVQDTYIFKHNEVLKDDGSPYLVFTPFYKKALKHLESKNIEGHLPQEHDLIDTTFDTISSIDENKSLKEYPLELQSMGFEKVAMEIIYPHEKLKHFKNKIAHYKEERDYLNSDVTSQLSVDLRFGTMGVREILRFLFENRDLDIEPFLRQLIFRDFYASLLFHMPHIEFENYKYKFNGIEDKEKFERFCQAKTGVPIVDAGVRELLETGNMHNRVRMVVASFFTKDLLLPWQWGERFFAQHLLDYDKASNVLSWQWSAGTGVDPQPYFRVFNPYLQSKKFDKEAKYIKQHIPEVKAIEAKHLHDEAYLLQAFIKGYPKPMLTHKQAAKKAIELFKP